MAKLESLKTLKIEALGAAMKYATRVDFSSHRQALIDSVRAAINPMLRNAGKDGTVEVEVDSDGDIVFAFRQGTFHFRLENRANASLGRFRDLYEHSLAFSILKTFYTQLIGVLGLRDIDVFALDFKNVFNFTEPDMKNYDVFQQRLVPRMRDALSPLVEKDASIARVDFNVGWDYDARRTCYYSVECPGNDNNTTVWAGLNLRTRGDIEVQVDEAMIASDIDRSFEVYCGPYAQVLCELLADIDLDFTKRLLSPP